MITNVGKLLVLLNAFVAAGVLAWSLSAYLNRQNPDDAADEAGEKLTDKVKRLQGEANVAQTAVAPELANVAAAEVRLTDIKTKIAARLKEADTGFFYDIYEARSQGPDPNDPTGLTRVRRVLWGQLDKARQVVGIDKTPLKGVKVMQNELQDESAKIQARVKGIDDKVNESNKLSDEILAHDTRSARLRRILEALVGETEYMADLRVSWDDRTATLQRRNRQLSARLAELGATKAAAPTPTAIVTLNPTR
jgi:hypothetical protein